MAGQLINRKVGEYIRAYHGLESNIPPNLDYDYLYPVTVFESVYESILDNAPSLSTVIDEIKESIKTKQNKVPAGTMNNIVAYSGTAGEIRELTRTELITATIPSQSKIPTEKAVVDYVVNGVQKDLELFKTKTNNKFTQIDNSITNIDESIRNISTTINSLTEEIAILKNSITTINNRLTVVEGNISTINKTIQNITNITDPTKPGNIYELTTRVENLENNVIYKSAFADGRYVRDVAFLDNSGSIVMRETKSSVKGEPDTFENTYFSSKGTVKIGYAMLGANPNISFDVDIITSVETQTFINAMYH